MRLYRLKDVKRAALLRHGGAAGLEEARARISQRTEVKKKAKADQKTVRKQEAAAA